MLHILGSIAFLIAAVFFIKLKREQRREERNRPVIGEFESRRPTLTRWLLLGPLSLALQKRTRTKIYKP